MRKILILVIALSLFLSSCSTADKKEVAAEDKDIEVGLSEGKLAPDFTLRNLEGRDIKLSDYRGKVVVLNFFGVWCPWCVKEMPGFVKVYNEYKDRGVELLIVDVGDSVSRLKGYLEDEKIGINPVMDSEQKVSALYNVTAYPTSYIIDEEGVIQKFHRGYMDEGTLKNVLDTMIRK